MSEMNEYSLDLFYFLQDRFPEKHIDEEFFDFLIREGFSLEVEKQSLDPFHLSKLQAEEIKEVFRKISEEGFDTMLELISQKITKRE